MASDTVEVKDREAIPPDTDTPLRIVIANLAALWERLTPEEQESAIVSHEYGDGGGSLVIEWERQATEEEKADWARQKLEAESRARDGKEREYYRLKRELGWG